MTDFKKGTALGLILGWFVLPVIGAYLGGTIMAIGVLGVAAYLFFAK